MKIGDKATLWLLKLLFGKVPVTDRNRERAFKVFEALVQEKSPKLWRRLPQQGFVRLIDEAIERAGRADPQGIARHKAFFDNMVDIAEALGRWETGNDCRDLRVEQIVNFAKRDY